MSRPRPRISVIASGNFGVWLLGTLNNYDLSVRDVADKTGVSPKEVRNWIKGHALPKTAYFIFLLRAMTQLTGVSEDTFYLSASVALLKDS